MRTILNTESLVQQSQVFLRKVADITNSNSAAIKTHHTRISNLETNLGKCLHKIDSLQTRICAGGISDLLVDNVPKSLIKHLAEDPPNNFTSPLVIIIEKIFQTLKIVCEHRIVFPWIFIYNTSVNISYSK